VVVPYELTIPEAIARSADEIHGAAGRAWIRRLPSLVEECVERWSLTLEPLFPNLTINFVAPAVRGDGVPVVLKVSFADEEFYAEVAALKLFDGRGAARVLEVDARRGVMLLERLQPGKPLTTVFDDQLATSVAARVMRQTRGVVPPTHDFPVIDNWVKRMADRSPRYVGSSTRFPLRWIRHALVLHNELCASAGEPVVLHGDLHHQNILSAEREGWLAIDPRGLVGEPAAETTPLLFSVLPPADQARTRKILARRIDQLAEELGIDRERIRAWGIIRAVLSSFRSLEERGSGWEWGLGLADALLAGAD
jgi:streptomycin 6-kinase